MTEDRNQEIVRLIDQQRMTKTAVAKRYNVSKQRVQQIYKREKERHAEDIRTAGNRENKIKVDKLLKQQRKKPIYGTTD